jgi:hypothetical protein
MKTTVEGPAMRLIYLALALLASFWAAPAAAQGPQFFYCYAVDARAGTVYMSDMHRVGPVPERRTYGQGFSAYLAEQGKVPPGTPAYCVMRATEKEIERGQMDLALGQCMECRGISAYRQVAWPRNGGAGTMLVTAPPPPAPDAGLDLRKQTSAAGPAEIGFCSRPSPGAGPGHAFVTFSRTAPDGTRYFRAIGHTVAAGTSPVGAALTFLGGAPVGGKQWEENYTSAKQDCLIVQVDDAGYQRAMAAAEPTLAALGLSGEGLAFAENYSLGDKDCVTFAHKVAAALGKTGLTVPDRGTFDTPASWIDKLKGANGQAPASAEAVPGEGLHIMVREEAAGMLVSANEADGLTRIRQQALERGGNWHFLVENDRCVGWMAVSYATNGRTPYYFLARGFDTAEQANLASRRMADEWKDAQQGTWITGRLDMFRNDYRRPPIEIEGDGLADKAMNLAQEMVHRIVVTGCGRPASPSSAVTGTRG